MSKQRVVSQVHIDFNIIHLMLFFLLQNPTAWRLKIIVSTSFVDDELIAHKEVGVWRHFIRVRNQLHLLLLREFWQIVDSLPRVLSVRNHEGELEVKGLDEVPLEEVFLD